MAGYMGPIASVAHILRKLSVIFGTAAPFDVLMQNFYEVTQGNNEKVPLYHVSFSFCLCYVSMTLRSNFLSNRINYSQQH